MPLTKREAEQLIRMHGGYFDHHGGSHDVWIAPNGSIILLPRHAGDLKKGLENNIYKKLGLK